MKKMFLSLILVLLTSITLCSCNKNNSKDLVLVRLDQGFIGDNASALSVSIGIKKNNDELKSLINGALNKLTQEQRNEMMVSATTRADGELTGTKIELPAYDPNKEDLIVGLECDYAPFNWTDISDNEYNYPIDGINGQYADGYDIMIAVYIAKEIGYNLVIKKYGWSALIPSLLTDDINVIIAGMTDTPARRESIDFTDTYYTSELVLIVRKNSELENIKNVSELSNKRVISQFSTVTDQIIDQIPGVIHLTPVDSFSIAALSVISGEADAMTAEYPVALAIVAANTSDE